MKNREHNRWLPTLILIVFTLMGGLIIQQWFVYRSETALNRQVQQQAGDQFTAIESRVSEIEQTVAAFQKLSVPAESSDTVFVTVLNSKCQNLLLHFPEVVSVWLISDSMLPNPQTASKNCYVLDSLLRSAFVWSETQSRAQLLLENSAIMRLYEKARRQGNSCYSKLLKRGDQWGFQVMVPVSIGGNAPIYLALSVDLSFVDYLIDVRDSKGQIATLLLSDSGDPLAVSCSSKATLPKEAYAEILFDYFPQILENRAVMGTAWSGDMGEELFVVSSVSEKSPITTGWILVRFYTDSLVNISFGSFQILLLLIYLGIIYTLFNLLFRQKRAF